MSIQISIIFSISLVISACSWAGKLKEKTNKEQTLQIAKQQFVKTYGKDVLKQKPFQATLENGVWTVTGSMNCPESFNCKGGVAEVEISEKDGKILNLTHGK